MTRSRDVANIDGILTTTGDTYYASAAATPARLAIGSTGQVLTVSGGVPTWATPSAAGFVGARVYLSAAFALANNTDTVINWDMEDYDTNAFHDTSVNTSRFTIPSGYAGKYLIWGLLQFAPNATGVRLWYLQKNGADLTVGSASSFTNSASYNTSLPSSFIANLSVGDYITCRATQTSGGSLNLAANTTSSTFGITYLGA